MSTRCNAYDNTKNRLLSYKLKLDGKEFFPGLVERNGEIILSKSNKSDINYITRRFQEHAHSKYGLPMSTELFRVYEAKSPLNKGYTALSIRKGNFIALEKYIDSQIESQETSKTYTPDKDFQRDLNYFNQDRALLEQEDREIRELRKEINQLESNYSPNIIPNNQVEATMKIVDVLNNFKRNKFEQSKLQGWINDLLKAGVTKQQIDLFKGVAKEGMTKENIALELASNYSYTVEINTAKEKDKGYDMIDTTGEGDFEPVEFIPDTDFEEQYDEEGNIIGIKEVLSEKGKQQIEERENKRKPTQYYSNLTVPGGTNYTEQEISTPLITPSIKGHAQFATDNGIGWFRSDDKLGDKYSVKATNRNTGVEQNMSQNMSLDEATEVANSFKDRFDNVRLEKYEEGDGSKTRRILEVQSDLFQKGRDSTVLVANTDGRGKFIGGDEYENYFSDENANDNKFLQLLNKDNNWVTFFVKSIIQDSAKKGYEKVLFPSGDTASKVEGHTTLEEFKKQKQDRLAKLENSKYILIDENVYQDNYNSVGSKFKTLEQVEEYRNKEDYRKNWKVLDISDKYVTEINQLKQELEQVEGPGGFGALKPIYNFYENTVTNILNKTYGKENVKIITDERGNTWNELILEESSTDSFNYSPSIITPSSIPSSPTNEEVKGYKNAYVEYFNYKNGLLNQTKKYLYDVNVEISKTKDPIKKAELIQTQQELKEAIYGNEIKGIEGLANEMSQVGKNKKVYQDLVDKRIKLEKNLDTLTKAGGDTTVVLNQLQDNALKLYELKNEDLSDIFRANSLQDLDRANRLIDTNKLENLVKAKEIINFYKNTSPNNQELNNPFYSKEELLSGKISQDVIEDLHDISNKAYDLENKVNNTSRQAILDYINSMDTFLKKNNNTPFTQEDIFKDKDGLIDITLLDQVINNIQDNPFSKVDSVLQAAIFKRVKDSLSQEEAAVKEITDELDERNPKVVKELLRLGHRLSNNTTLAGIRHRVLGRLNNTPDFSIFKQISNEGVLRNKLVQRESDKYKTLVKTFKNQFNKDLSALLSGADTSKTFEDINNTYYNKLRGVSEIIKPHLIPEIVNDARYNALLDLNTTAPVDDTYKNSIISRIGTQGYEDILEKQRNKLDSYLIAKSQKEDTLLYMYAVENSITDPSTLTLADLDDEKQNNLVDWIIDHSPFYNGLLFDENKKVRTRDRRYNNYELDYSEFLPRTKEAKVVYQRSYPDNVSKNFRLVRAVETTRDSNYLDERYKYIEDNPLLYDFWKTAMKSSEYYQQSLSTEERQNWEDGDLPIDDRVSIDRFIGGSDKVKDKILSYLSINFRKILKNIYTQVSSTMDLPYSEFDYNDNRLNVNSSELNIGTRSINNEIRLREIELKKYFKDRNMRYRDTSTIDNLPPKLLRDALHLYGANKAKISRMDDAQLVQEYISSFNIQPNSAGRYVTNVLSVLKDLHTQNALKQTNGDLGLTLLKSASLASGIIARKKNTDMIQFMVDAFNNINLVDSNSFFSLKTNKSGNKVILNSVRPNAVRQMTNFIKNQFELRGAGTNQLIVDKNKAEELNHGFLNNYVLDNGKDLDLIDELLANPDITEQEKSDLLKIKLQKIRYFDGVKGVLRPVSAQLRLVSLGFKTVSNITNLYEGTKQILIHDATGQDWTPGKGTEALAIMKGAFVRNLTQFNDKLDKTITPQASKARFIIDRLDFIEDASTLEAKALKKQSTSGVIKDISSGLNPYVLIKKIEYVNQGSVALAMLMSQPITDSSGNISNVWEALDGKGKLKSEFRTPENIESWEKFNSQEALDFKSKLNNARNKTSGDYSQLGESQLNTMGIGKLVLNFKKWMPKYLAQMYGNHRYDYDSGKYIKGRAKSLHPAELVLHRVASSLTLKGFGVHALFLAPMIVTDFISYNKDLDPNKPQLKDMVGRLGLMTKVALKTSVGFPVNLVASGVFQNKPIINTSSDKIFGKSLESKLLAQGIKPEDIGNIKAMGVELGMNLINVVGILLIYGTLLSGGDDDEETPRTLGYTKNEWGNIAANTLMPLLKQGESFYADPLVAFTTVNNIPLMTYIEQLDKSATSLDRVINGLDTDYISRGRDAGKYKSDKLVKKLIPVPMRDMESKKYMRFEEYIPGQLMQDPAKLLDKKTGNLRSEIKRNLGKDITKENIEEMYNKYEFEYISEDKEGEEIPYMKLKKTLLEKVMKKHLPKPSKGDKEKAYEDLQKVRDGEMNYTDWNSQYVLSKEEKEELKEE